MKVAISAEFLTAFSKISRDRQGRVREFIDRFKANPAAPGLNYEKITDARDANLRSVRVDQQYRAIVLRPQAGDVYVLLWVDNHDDAYAWARNRKIEIHPDTGALQVVDVTAAPASTAPTDRVALFQDQGLFGEYRDRELIRLGIPEALLPLVRGIETEADLVAAGSQLPEEALEALYGLAAGLSKEEVYSEVVAQREAAPVDTSDFGAALGRADSQRRFTVVEDDLTLQEMLAAPLERWRIFLHPSQRKLVEMSAGGPVRVLGGAGTGKTVVAMHRAKWLAERVFTGAGDRVLVTTYTTNLATDLRMNLQKLCPPATMRRIEVTNIDAWVTQFLRQHGYDYQVAFWERLSPLWENALNQADPELQLPEQFYRCEWEQVIQEQGIETLLEYARADRSGRGQALPRDVRQRVWPVFEEYRSQLSAHRLKEMTDATRDARRLLASLGPVLPYRAVVVDEAQDMTAEVFRLIRQMIPVAEGGTLNDLFIVGDAHQRIYASPVVLGRCGIDIRGRGRKLRVNYRTTEETRRWACQLVEGRPFDDLDGGPDNQDGYKSLLHGPTPVIRRFGKFPDEIRGIAATVRYLMEQGAGDRDVCIVARTNDLVSQYDGALKSLGFETYRIQRSIAEDRTAGGLRLATMHRVKGLEFDHVVVAGVCDGVVPLPQAMQGDGSRAESELGERRERSLFYVAATRAKRSVLVTCHGEPSPFLRA